MSIILLYGSIVEKSGHNAVGSYFPGQLHCEAALLRVDFQVKEDTSSVQQVGIERAGQDSGGLASSAGRLKLNLPERRKRSMDKPSSLEPIHG